MHALVPWDRDGAGPLPPLVVVCGSFRAVGQLPAPGVAAYDPATGQWTALGTGVDGEVRCAVAMPNGDLVIGGSFTQAGGNPAARIARWDGTTWSALAGGIPGVPGTYVDALAVAPNGDLMAGGSFTSAGGVAAGLVARWDGSTWSTLGTGLVGVAVNALTHLSDGSLVASGTFWQAGGLAVNNVARFDGSAWSPLGQGLRFLSNNAPGVCALQVLGNGHLVAGGAFEASGTTTVNCIAEWDGATWSPLGAGLGGASALTLASSQLVALAPLAANGWGPTRWNGSSWANLAPAVGTANCITELPNGDILVGGTFSSVGGVAMHNLARWNGVSWLPAVTASVPFAATVPTLLAMSNGDVIAANLTQTSAQVARRTGSTWSPLPGLPAIPSFPQPAACFAESANGDLVIFVTGSGPLRWNGTTWVSVGTPIGFPIAQAMLGLPDGSLLIAGVFASSASVLRWDGATWTPWATSFNVMALGRLPNGDVVAGGSFLSIGGVPAARVARFDGSQWHPLGSGVDNVVRSITTFPDGSIVVSGDFTTAGGTPAPNIARWDGSTWSRFGPGMVPKRVAGLPDGEVVVVGDLTIGGITRTGQVAHSAGQQWLTFSPGLNGIARDVVVLPNGDVVVGGDFTNAGGFGSAYVAELASSCPATAFGYGTGCTGSAGLLTLQAVHLPWLGGLCQTRGTGVAANGIACGVIGWSATATPLGAFHPAAGVGCTALASPDAVVWLQSFSGIVDWRFRVPNAPALVGVALREQIVDAEIGPLGDLLRLTSSNGIALTVGAL